MQSCFENDFVRFPVFYSGVPLSLDSLQLRIDASLAFAAFKIRVIADCDLVQDFLGVDTLDDVQNDDEPELHVYNADEDLGQGSLCCCSGALFFSARSVR